MSRISLLCIGSRGDVQPYVALGRSLIASGHGVTVATHRPFQALVEGHGLAFAELPGDPREVILSEHGQGLLESEPGAVRFVRRFAQLLEPWWWELVRTATPVCERSEVIIYSPLGFIGWHLGEAAGIPTALAALQPFAPTASFPAVTVGRDNLGRLGNRMSHLVAEQAAWQTVRRVVDGWRTSHLGLPPLGWRGPRPVLRDRAEPQLFGYSSAIVPRPPDWRPEHHVTGYWFLDSGTESLPGPIESFIESGPAPVYVGFGSMAARDAGRSAHVVTDAARRAGVRLVLSAGWGGLSYEGGDDQVYLAGEVPHGALFPRMAAVVHHGGAGTTASGFRAGVPQLVVPFFADQPFWGRRTEATGVGPPPIPHRDLEPGRLAAALAQLADPDLRSRAAAVGRAIRRENGARRAATIVDALG